MAPLPTTSKTSTAGNTIHHFTHPEHPLVEVYDNTHEFLCNGCMITGIGKRYPCQKNCNFNLHIYCGRSPEKLTSFIHPQHQLSIVMRKPKSVNIRTCNVCTDNVGGLFYRCKICDFDVHPLCTQLPQYVCHVMDSTHKLELKPPSLNTICDICNHNILKHWCYRCDVCSVDVHTECVFASSLPRQPEPSLLSKSRSMPGQLFGGHGTAAAGFGGSSTHGAPGYNHSQSFGGFGAASPHGQSPSYSNMYNDIYQQQIMASANMYSSIYQKQLEQMMAGVNMQNNVYQQQLAQMMAGVNMNNNVHQQQLEQMMAGVNMNNNDVYQQQLQQMMAGGGHQSHNNYNSPSTTPAGSSMSSGGAGRMGTKIMLSVLGNMASNGLSDVVFGSSGFDLFSLFG